MKAPELSERSLRTCTSAPTALDEVAKVPERLGELSTQVADLETDLGHSDGKGHHRIRQNGTARCLGAARTRKAPGQLNRTPDQFMCAYGGNQVLDGAWDGVLARAGCDSGIQNETDPFSSPRQVARDDHAWDRVSP